MNVCAVKTLSTSHGNEPYWYVIQNFPLPHEPKSTHRFYLPLTLASPDYVLDGGRGTYAECKHCVRIRRTMTDEQHLRSYVLKFSS